MEKTCRTANTAAFSPLHMPQRQRRSPRTRAQSESRSAAGARYKRTIRPHDRRRPPRSRQIRHRRAHVPRSPQTFRQSRLADSFLVFSIRLFELKDHILAAREPLRSHRHPCRAARGAFSAATWVQITIGQIPANNSPSAAAG
jgi:hypothetical protein